MGQKALAFIEKNFSVLLIAALIIFLWNKGIFKPSVPVEPKIIRDTAYVIGQSSIQQYQPPTIVSIPPTVIPQQYTPDTSYKGLIRQYQALIQDYLSKNVTKDTLHLKDSSGREFAQVPLEDTITKNKIVDRKYFYTYSFPVITNTVTLPYKPKNQLYYGFEISSPIGNTLGIQQVKAGIALKNKKNNILKLSTGYNFPTHSPIASIGYYKKLFFHK